MKHKLDLLFPILLFGCLSICAVFTILVGIHFYEDTSDRIASNYESRTALSYLREKIHQNDENGNISLGTFEGNDCLIIEQTYEDKFYYTYIYAYENALWELTVQDGIDVSPEDGTKILDVAGFYMEESETGRFHFTYTNADGRTITSTVSALTH